MVFGGKFSIGAGTGKSGSPEKLLYKIQIYLITAESMINWRKRRTAASAPVS